MATITNANLTLEHNHTRKTVRAKVTCNVNFSAIEMCQMKSCPEGRWFKLTCQLWGEDAGLEGWLGGGDDLLFTYPDVFYFPDQNPTTPESRTFDITLGEGVLNEDLFWWEQDGIYGLLTLVNLYTSVTARGRTNTVKHHF
mgnify:CR=1 FL=1